MKFLGTVFLWVLMFYSSIFMTVFIFTPLMAYREMDRWIGIQAELLTCELVQKLEMEKLPVTGLACKYTYELWGERYESSQTVVGGDRMSFGRIDEVWTAYELGNPIDIWVNPETPQEAALERVYPFYSLYVIIILAIILGTHLVVYRYGRGVLVQIWPGWWRVYSRKACCETLNR